MSFTLSEPHSNPDIRIISLGAGVQSTVLALMASKGEIGPMPDCAIFADTGYEPQGVYDHLEWLIKELPFPTYIVDSGNIRDDTINGINSTGQTFATMPFFGETGGIGRRQCTNEYKIKPIVKKTRELLGVKPKHKAKNVVAEQWMGISWDEMQRMKVNPKPYIHNRYPLIEQKMRRHNCMAWFEEHYPGKTLTRSACIACPFNNNERWRDLKTNDPSAFADAVLFDKTIRKNPNFKKEVYLHKSLRPLDEIDFDNAEDKGQLSFLDECEGMCGL